MEKREKPNRNEYMRNYRAANKEKLKAWYDKNKEKRHDSQRRFYRKHAEELNIASSARVYFFHKGMGMNDVPRDIFNAKIMHIRLKRAIKGHKEVTNG